jgi:hypothetical protein
LPTTLANFCCYYQRYQSLATVRTSILPVSLEKQIGHVLAAVVVIFAAGVNGVSAMHLQPGFAIQRR